MLRSQQPMGFMQLDSLPVPISGSIKPSKGPHSGHKALPLLATIVSEKSGGMWPFQRPIVNSVLSHFVTGVKSFQLCHLTCGKVLVVVCLTY